MVEAPRLTQGSFWSGIGKTKAVYSPWNLHYRGSELLSLQRHMFVGRHPVEAIDGCMEK